MSFFPAGFDPRADVVAVFQLVNINTTDGDFGFLVGTDGRFRDVNGKDWWGSQLIGSGPLETSIGGTAPRGEISLSYFQDPEAGDLISQIKALGNDYVKDRPITFYVQPFFNQEYQAPQIAPIQRARRFMRSITYQFDGPLGRRISVGFETELERRQRARRMVYNTVDHARLTGSANPSLELMPSDSLQDEKLF
ncbi:MAG: hypothetical protein QNJ44_22530 [Rhodobacter sp.]|nr:hypothetical protein [Rhodobacter sp.]